MSRTRTCLAVTTAIVLLATLQTNPLMAQTTTGSGGKKQKTETPAPETGMSQDTQYMQRLTDGGFQLYKNGSFSAALSKFREAADYGETAFGPKHSDTLVNLSNIAATLVALNRTEEAERLQRRVLETSEQVLGSEHPFTLDSLDSLVEMLRSLDRLAGAEPLQRASMEALKRRLGPDHFETIKSFEKLSTILYELHRSKEAEPFARLAFETRDRKFGFSHPDTLKALASFVTILLDIGDFAKSESLFRSSLADMESIWGLDNPWTLSSLSGLALATLKLGRPVEAEALYRQALEAQESILGPEHSSTLLTLNGLALSLNDLGRNEEAELLNRRLLAVNERVWGPEHPQTLTILSNLAIVLNELGRGAEAEPLFRRAVEISERVPGTDKLNFLNNFGTNLMYLDRNAEAEVILRRALEKNLRVYGPEHRITLINLGNLASALNRLDRGEEAETLQRRVVDGLKRVLGPDHPTTLTHFHQLATTLRGLGLAAEAEPLFRQVFEARERLIGPDHRDTFTSLTGLARTLDELGRAPEALPIQRRAFEASDRILGAENPDTLAALNNLAFIYLSLNDPLSALPLSRRLVSSMLDQLSEVSDSAEATQAAVAGRARDAGFLLAYTVFDIALRGLGSGPDYTPDALRSEGFFGVQVGAGGSSGSAVARSAARVAAGQAGLADVVAAWEGAVAAREAVDRQISDAAGNTALDAASLAALRANLAAARAEAVARIGSSRARLESEFPRFFDLVSPAPVSVAELQGTGLQGAGDGAALLGETEALVLLTPGWGDRAGLVWAVSREGVAWAEIGLSPEALTAKIGALHANIDKARSSNLRAPSVGADGGVVVPDRLGVGFDRTLSHELYEALFGDPEISAVLEGKTDWILAPQGALLSVPYAALVSAAPEGAAAGRDDDPLALRATAWLGLERALTVVPSVSTVRALRRLGKVGSGGPGLPFFGLGDPAFEGAPLGQRGADAATDEVRLASAESFFRGATGQIEAVRALPRLPGTRTEVEAMATAFGAGAGDILLGAEANETRLAERSDDGSLGQARVVLFATHGLMAGGERGFAGLSEPALALSPPQGVAVLIDVADNGADNRTGDGPLDEADIAAAVQRGARLDDGLLTASEAARLDLDADWVILSACDTAAGSTPDAEGLSGLARAFFYAGARSLLVSHWPVEDAAAARLTTDAVTRARTDPNLTRAQAFQASMRDLAQDTANPQYAHPAFWAPFQIVGVE